MKKNTYSRNIKHTEPLESLDIDEIEDYSIKSLSRAMIERAILDCKLNHDSIKRKSGWLTDLVNDPEYWIFHDTSEDFPSFAACCEILGLHPRILRDFTTSYLDGKINVEKTQPFCRNYVSKP